MKYWIAVAAVAVWAAQAEASVTVTLQWDLHSDPSVVGYNIHYRDLATDIEIVANAGNRGVFPLPDLKEGRTYSIYVTSYDAEGLESIPSNTLEYTVPLAPLRPVLASSAQGLPTFQLHIDGVTDRRVALQSSTNLADWITVLTGDVGQPLDYEAADLTQNPHRFYRSTLVPLEVAESLR